MEQPHLSVIIPAYNEAKRIGATLEKLGAYLRSRDYTSEVLVISDGSSDATAEAVRGYQDRVPDLRIIDRKENRGKGYTVREGMLAATGAWRLFMDADGSTSIDHIEKMWPYVKEGKQVIIGSRDPKDAKGATQAVPQSFFKRMLGNFGNILIQIFGVPGIWDTQNGFKMFSAEATERIFSKARIDGWGFDIEALALARKFGYDITVIPVHWVNDPMSHVTLGGYLNTFVELLKVRWGLMTGRYEEARKQAESDAETR